MSSTRLPGKVMRDLAGAPMIERQVERLRRARGIDRLVVATSDRPDDDILAEHIRALGLGVHRGPLDDVLARFAGAAAAFGPARHVVRFTADCPLIDPEIVDRLVEAHLRSGADYSTNGGDGRAYAVGLDCEIMTADALRDAARDAVEPYDREHVTPFIYRRPERYAVHRLPGPEGQGDLRWTVDTADDLDFARTVFAGLYARLPDFRAADVLAFVRGRPDLMSLGGERRG